MRIAAVSLANFQRINSEKRSNINKNQYSSDVFVKSQPSFGNWRNNAHTDDLKELLRIKEYVAPIIEKTEADWKHLCNLVDINDKNERAMSISKSELTSFISEPFKKTGYKIFSLVDQKLEKFDEYIQNKNNFASLLKSAKSIRMNGKTDAIEKEINSAYAVFVQEPDIITELRPLAATRMQTKKDIKNGLANIDFPPIEESREAFAAGYAIAKNPYSRAVELRNQVEGYFAALEADEPLMENVQNALYRKLNLVYEEDKAYTIRVSHLKKPVSELKPAEYDVAGYKSKVEESLARAKKIVLRNADRLERIYNVQFSNISETTPELEALLAVQNNTNKNISEMLQARFNEILAKNSDRIEEVPHIKYDEDMPF